MIVDNFSITGTWTWETHCGHNTNEWNHAQGAGTDYAQLTVSVSPGMYHLWATWFPFSNRATDAKYEIYDGTTLRGTMYINQVQTPNDIQDGGVGWDDFGHDYEIASGTLTVRVYQSASGQVIADAIRYEYMGPIDPPTPGEGLDPAEVLAADLVAAVDRRDAAKAAADEQYEYDVQQAHERAGI